MEAPAPYRETLAEYMASYADQSVETERLDKRIEELSSQEKYQKKVKKLGCF